MYVFAHAFGTQSPLFLFRSSEVMNDNVLNLAIIQYHISIQALCGHIKERPREYKACVSFLQGSAQFFYIKDKFSVP